MTNTEAVQFLNCNFTGNACNGGYGGAIIVAKSPNANSSTYNIDAEKYVLGYTQVTVDDCIFDGNWAGNDGFAIQNYDAEFTITDTVFKNNVGIHPSSSVGTFSCQVVRNNSYADEIVENCLFEKNTGPVSCIGDHGGKSWMYVSNTDFKENSGNKAVLYYTAVGTFENCDFINDRSTNTVIHVVINSPGYWYANSGAAMGRLTLTDCAILDSTAEYPDIRIQNSANNDPSLTKSTVILNGVISGDVLLTDENFLVINGTYTGTITTDEKTRPETYITIADGAKLNGEIIDKTIE